MNREFVVVDDVVARTVTTAITTHWRRMAETTHPLVVILTELHAQRSSAQNRRLYAMERDIAHSAWVPDLAGKPRQFNEEAWHEFFVQTLSPFANDAGVDGRPRRLRTHEMSVGQIAEYMTAIESYATGELGIEFGYG